MARASGPIESAPKTRAEYARKLALLTPDVVHGEMRNDRPQTHPLLIAIGGFAGTGMLLIVRNRILRPIAGSLFGRPPKSSLKPNSKLQAQYRRTTKSFNDPIALLKAA